jgi:hypothetical protein
MKTNKPLLLILTCLVFCISGYSQKDSAYANTSERKVMVNPNPFKDSTLISITGNYHIQTLKISICTRNGLAVMEFIPKQLPYRLNKGDLAPGKYYVRCIDKYGRMASKKMTIVGNEVAETE